MRGEFSRYIGPGPGELRRGRESLNAPKNIFWASKKLVIGPNGIMVAQTFCDIFFMTKRHQISIYKQFSVIMALISPYTNQPFIVPHPMD
jgi:hypothetical protein